MLYATQERQNPGTIASTLLKEVRENRADAWSQMVQRYALLVYYWCRRAGLQPTDAEDMVQEVFTTVAARVGTFVRAKSDGSFRGWLRTIARNKIGNFLKMTRRRAAFGRELLEASCVGSPATVGPDPGPEEVPCAEIRILYLRVVDLVRSEFEEQTWQVFWRLVVDGVPAKLVADEMDMSINAVYLAKSRVLRRMRDEVNDHAKVPHPR